MKKKLKKLSLIFVIICILYILIFRIKISRTDTMFLNYQPFTVNDEMIEHDIIQMKHNEIVDESEKEILEGILNHKIIIPFYVVKLILLFENDHHYSLDSYYYLSAKLDTDAVTFTPDSRFESGFVYVSKYLGYIYLNSEELKLLRKIMKSNQF